MGPERPACIHFDSTLLLSKIDVSNASVLAPAEWAFLLSERRRSSSEALAAFHPGVPAEQSLHCTLAFQQRSHCIAPWCVQVLEAEFGEANRFNDQVNEQVRKGIALPIGDEAWLTPEMKAQLSLAGLKRVSI